MILPVKGFLDQEISYKRVWSLAWPIILANITIPLIGATNIAVMGHLKSPKFIGGVALSVVVLQCIYWSFAFLRKGTTGVTAQAFGAGDMPAVFAALFRSLLIAISLGTIVIILQKPISWIAFAVLNGSEEVESLAKIYYDIRIWGSIATMGNYVMLGWFYGIQKPKLALSLRVAMNALNIPLAIYLVLGLKMEVAGAAWAAFASHIFVFVISLIAAAVLFLKEMKTEDGKIDWAFVEIVKDKAHLFRVFKINSDFFVRTILVFFAFSWFTAKGAKQGDLVLAANTVLINLFWFISYALDGFSNAAETLVGQSIGAQNKEMFDKTVKKTTVMAGYFAIAFCLVYWAFDDILLHWMTNLPEVKNAALDFMPWLVFMPIVGIWCFQLDGIYIGATETRIMRDMMIISFAAYALAINLLTLFMGNHGLWLALHIFMAVRAITLFVHFKKIGHNFS